MTQGFKTLAEIFLSSLCLSVHTYKPEPGLFHQGSCMPATDVLMSAFGAVSSALLAAQTDGCPGTTGTEQQQLCNLEAGVAALQRRALQVQ